MATNQTSILKSALLRYNTQNDDWLIIFQNGERLTYDSVIMTCHCVTTKAIEGGSEKNYLKVTYVDYIVEGRKQIHFHNER